MGNMRLMACSMKLNRGTSDIKIRAPIKKDFGLTKNAVLKVYH